MKIFKTKLAAKERLLAMGYSIFSDVGEGLTIYQRQGKHKAIYCYLREYGDAAKVTFRAYY